MIVRHPPRSGWLDEWGRLKGGHLLSLGVALKRAFVNGSERSVGSIRGFLFAYVCADLFQLKADHGRRRRRGPTKYLPDHPTRKIRVSGFFICVHLRLSAAPVLGVVAGPKNLKER